MARELTLSLILLILCSISKSATAISCYECSSTVGVDNIETNPGCASVTGSTPKSPLTSTTCVTTVTVIGGGATITRSGISNYNATRNYCEHSGRSETTCYCITNDCNSEDLTTGPYDCYDCSSADYFDNGCGETVVPGEKYVNTVHGCGGCFKRVTYDGDYTMKYQRGCIKGLYVENNHCNGTVTDTCVCKGSLCNSAEKFKFTSASAAIFLLTFLSILF